MKKLMCWSCVGLALLLTAFTEARAQVLYSDDFSDGDSSVWITYTSGWNESGGEYHATNTAANTPVASVYSNGFLWTDYSIEADVQPLTNRPTSAAGIRFRFQAPNPSADRCVCDLFRDSSNQTFVQFSCYGVNNDLVPFPWSAGNTYRLRATASGTTATCEVVGSPGTIQSVTDPGLGLSGTAGLRATHIAADFDNFLVIGGTGPSGGNAGFLVFSEGAGIVRTNLDGSREQTLTSNTKDQNPRISPDGSSVVFWRFRDLFLVDSDGDNERLLRTGAATGIPRHICWSPDGRQVAYSEGPVGSNRLHVVNADGSGHETLYSMGDFGQPPHCDWSFSDEIYIPFGPPAQGAALEIIACQTDRSGCRTVTSNPGSALAEYPVLSSSRDRLFYATRPNPFGQPRTIRRSELDGDDEITITGSGSNAFPAATFSGRLYYTDNVGGDFQFYSVLEDGGDVQPVSSRPGGVPSSAHIFVGRTTNEDPIAAAGADETVSAGSACRARVTLDGTGSSDPDGDQLTFEWLSPAGDHLTGPTPVVGLPLGSHTFVLTVDDGFGGTDTDEVTITVEDTSPPDVSAFLDQAVGDDASLFLVEFSAADNCDPAPVTDAVLDIVGCGALPGLQGQLIEFEQERDECEVENDDGVLEIEAAGVRLVVSATDAAGNMATAIAELPAGSASSDDDSDSDSEGDSDSG